MRHALRPRTTILIRAGRVEVPFDLRTDRYLKYDHADPAATRGPLTEAVRESLLASNVDSPVFRLVPGLVAADPEIFRPVPEDFREAVETARLGRDLPLLAVLGEEALLFDWGVAGSRVVGRAQFDLEAYPDACATWKAILRLRPNDPRT